MRQSVSFSMSSYRSLPNNKSFSLSNLRNQDLQRYIYNELSISKSFMHLSYLLIIEFSYSRQLVRSTFLRRMIISRRMSSFSYPNYWIYAFIFYPSFLSLSIVACWFADVCVELSSYLFSCSFEVSAYLALIYTFYCNICFYWFNFAMSPVNFLTASAIFSLSSLRLSVSCFTICSLDWMDSASLRDSASKVFLSPRSSSSLDLASLWCKFSILLSYFSWLFFIFSMFLSFWMRICSILLLFSISFSLIRLHHSAYKLLFCFVYSATYVCLFVVSQLSFSCKCFLSYFS